MNKLLVGDCLWSDITRVLREDRPDRTPEQLVFAVFTELGERGVFCGLVTVQEVAQEPALSFGGIVKGKVIHSVPPNVSAYQALTVMDRENLNALPVLDELGALTGVVTRQNIMRALVQHESALLEELQVLRHKFEEEDRKTMGRTARLVQLDKTSQNLLNVLGLTLIETNLLQAGLTLIETNLLQAGIEALTVLLRARYGAIGILKEPGVLEKDLKYFVYTGISPEVAKSIGAPPEVGTSARLTSTAAICSRHASAFARRQLSSSAR